MSRFKTSLLREKNVFAELSRFLSQTKFTVASATTFAITTLSITTPSVTLKDLKMICCVS
jgi:hypothetical protein